MQATRYIAEQREHYTSRAYEILREQRTEFETQAQAYQEMAREVATNELQQQRVTVDQSHQQQMSRIASYVTHEESLARGRLLEVDNQLATTAANAHTVEAHAEDYVRANYNLEAQLVAARGAAASPERRYAAALRANETLSTQGEQRERARVEELQRAELQKNYYLQQLTENMEAMTR